MRFTEFLTVQDELTEATQFKGYGKHKGVLTRTVTKAEQEEKARKEADKLALKAAAKPVPIDLAAVARSIDDAVSNYIPDGDPIDPLIRKWAHKVKEGELIKLLDKATKKHLGSKTYYEYIAQCWDDYAELSPDEVEGYKNPWK
jgi:hypothetical protein